MPISLTMCRLLCSSVKGIPLKGIPRYYVTCWNVALAAWGQYELVTTLASGYKVHISFIELLQYAKKPHDKQTTSICPFSYHTCVRVVPCINTITPFIDRWPKLRNSWQLSAVKIRNWPDRWGATPALRQPISQTKWSRVRRSRLRAVWLLRRQMDSLGGMRTSPLSTHATRTLTSTCPVDCQVYTLLYHHLQDIFDRILLFGNIYEELCVCVKNLLKAGNYIR